jgi:hypothetical protein
VRPNELIFFENEADDSAFHAYNRSLKLEPEGAADT